MLEPCSAEGLALAISMSKKPRSAIDGQSPGAPLNPLHKDCVTGEHLLGGVFVQKYKGVSKNFVEREIGPFLNKIADAAASPGVVLECLDMWFEGRRIDNAMRQQRWTTIIGPFAAVTRAQRYACFVVHFSHFPSPGHYVVMVVQTV